MPMDRKRYPKKWRYLSDWIRFVRAGCCCEKCGAAHGRPHPITGSVVELTTHHIGVAKPDGTPGDPEDKMDCREENLIALCQKCHLKADEPIRIVHSRITRNANKHKRIAGAGQLDLFDEEHHADA